MEIRLFEVYQNVIQDGMRVIWFGQNEATVRWSEVFHSPVRQGKVAGVRLCESLQVEGEVKLKSNEVWLGVM